MGQAEQVCSEELQGVECCSIIDVRQTDKTNEKWDETVNVVKVKLDFFYYLVVICVEVVDVVVQLLLQKN